MNRDELEALPATDLSALTREQVEALARLGLKVLRDVDAADLTPAYDYPGPGRGKRQTWNRLGQVSEPGRRWHTPHEIVADAASIAATIIRRKEAQ